MRAYYIVVMGRRKDETMTLSNVIEIQVIGIRNVEVGRKDNRRIGNRICLIPLVNSVFDMCQEVEIPMDVPKDGRLNSYRRDVDV